MPKPNLSIDYLFFFLNLIIYLWWMCTLMIYTITFLFRFKNMQFYAYSDFLLIYGGELKFEIVTVTKTFWMQLYNELPNITGDRDGWSSYFKDTATFHVLTGSSSFWRITAAVAWTLNECLLSLSDRKMWLKNTTEWF